jgi:hypothetical protein
VQETNHISFEDDGSIITTSDSTTKTTTFLDNGDIETVLKINLPDGSIETITQRTVFNDDGSIDNLITDVVTKTGEDGE